MNKSIGLSVCLVLTLSGNVFAGNVSTPGLPGIKPIPATPASPTPTKPVTPGVANSAPASPAPAKAVTSSAPSMPAMPPAAHVQLELVKISQEFLANFNQAEITQLGQAFETTLNTALASKDFDQAFASLLNSVQGMAAVIGSKLSVCKEIQVKLNQAVAQASGSFNKLISSGMVPAQTNEFYFIKIANAILAGLKQGLAKVKPSKEECATPVAPAPAAKAPAAPAPVNSTAKAPAAPAPVMPIPAPVK